MNACETKGFDMFKCRLKVVLAERSSSMLQLSQETGIPYSQINDFANMKRNSINLQLWERIGVHLGVDPTGLIVWEDKS